MTPRTLVTFTVLLSFLPGACSDDVHVEPARQSPTAQKGEKPTAENTPVPRAKGPRTVVLISLDTLRPDRLGLYGNTEGPLTVSPRLDALAEDAVVFDQSLASSPWTLPSHMTMLTGLDPIAHGVKNAHPDFAISPKVPMLAQTLKESGFATGAFTDGGYVNSSFGFSSGFDVFEDDRSTDKSEPNGFSRLLPDAMDWLKDRPDDEDVFLFLHTFDTHAPFQEGDEEVLKRFRERPAPDGPNDWGLSILGYMHQQSRMRLDEYVRISQLLNDYDAGVYEVDRGVGEVLDTLKAMGRYDDALILVTSDHGESFFDHNLHIGHGIGLKDDELRVPLIIKYPGGIGRGTRHDELVGLIDIPKTVFEVVDVESPETTQGESLVGLSRGIRRKVDYLIGESQNIRGFFLVQNGHKYITPVAVSPMLIAQRHLGVWSPDSIKPNPSSTEYTLGEGPDKATLSYDTVGDPLGLRDVLPASEELYDRTKDPGELANIADEDPALLEKMRNLFQNHYDTSDAVGMIFFDPKTSGDVDPADLRVLAALGYLDAGNKKQLREVPPAMRDWVLNSWEAPSTDLLKEADQRVQRVRARAAGNRELTEADRDALQKSGRQYLQWYEKNLHFRARVEWRILVILDLAEAHGFKMNTASWSKNIPRGNWTRKTLIPETSPGAEAGEFQKKPPAENGKGSELR
jgi:arylsulfatase A-like enzyme